MMSRWLAILLCLFVPMAAWAGETAETTKPAVAPPPPPPVLSVAAFAGLPLVDRAHLSPNGKYVAGLFSVGGRQKIVTMPLVGDRSGATVAVIPEGTEAGTIRWVNDDNIVVKLTTLMPVITDRWYVTRLISINRLTGKITKLLWDSGGQNAADILWVPDDGSSEILVAAQNTIYSDDEEFWPTVYRVDVVTGKKKRDLSGRVGVMDWYADDLGAVRMGVGYDNSSVSSRLYYRSSGSGSFSVIDKAKHKKDETLDIPFQFLPGGDHALFFRDNDAGKTGIVEVDIKTRDVVRTVLQLEDKDIEGAWMSDDGKTLLGAFVSDSNKPIVWIDPAMVAVQNVFNEAVPNGRATVESMSSDRTKFLVRVDSPENPGLLYYYDTAQGELTKYAAVNESIGNRKLSPVKLVKYEARDGLSIEAVLTVPRNRGSKKLPLVVMPHGGPWANDGLDYDYWAQFIASRGYAVLQPNFRGSTGYGTEFVKKGEGQMGLAMQDDITDGVKWAVDQGIAAPGRVCIVGASYGGYAAMWGIVKDPDQYRCAISIAGVSNLRREVNDFGGALKSNLYRSQWEAMTPDFGAVSPIKFVDKIKVPLLLIHGKKDVTVDHVQSEKMYSAMKKAEKEVEFVSLPEADHYFTREEDRVVLLSAIERFLAKNLPVE